MSYRRGGDHTGGGGGFRKVPPRWLNCPRKSSRLIGDKFLACKTPLNQAYNDIVPDFAKFRPEFIIDSMKTYGVSRKHLKYVQFRIVD